MSSGKFHAGVDTNALLSDKLFSSIAQWFWNGYIVYHELIIPLVNSLKILHACRLNQETALNWVFIVVWFFWELFRNVNVMSRYCGVTTVPFLVVFYIVGVRRGFVRFKSAHSGRWMFGIRSHIVRHVLAAQFDC